jgi:hypothetical protein
MRRHRRFGNSIGLWFPYNRHLCIPFPVHLVPVWIWHVTYVTCRWGASRNTCRTEWHGSTTAEGYRVPVVSAARLGTSSKKPDDWLICEWFGRKSLFHDPRTIPSFVLRDWETPWTFLAVVAAEIRTEQSLNTSLRRYRFAISLGQC